MGHDVNLPRPVVTCFASALRILQFAVVLFAAWCAAASYAAAQSSTRSVAPAAWLFNKPSPYLPVDSDFALQLTAEVQSKLEVLILGYRKEDGFAFTHPADNLILLYEQMNNNEGALSAAALRMRLLAANANWSDDGGRELDRLSGLMLRLNHPELARKILDARARLIGVEINRNESSRRPWEVDLLAIATSSRDDVAHYLGRLGPAESCKASGILARMGRLASARLALDKAGAAAIAGMQCQYSNDWVETVLAGFDEASAMPYFRAEAISKYQNNAAGVQFHLQQRMMHLAIALAWRSEFQAAESLASRIADSSFRARSGHALALALLHAGRHDEAIRIFSDPRYVASVKDRFRDEAKYSPDIANYHSQQGGLQVLCLLDAIGSLPDARRILSVHWPENRIDALLAMCRDPKAVGFGPPTREALRKAAAHVRQLKAPPGIDGRLHELSKQGMLLGIARRALGISNLFDAPTMTPAAYANLSAP